MDPVTSPCVNICRLDVAGTLCTGCFRTLTEIAQWGAAEDEERRLIVRRAAQRKQSFSVSA